MTASVTFLNPVAAILMGYALSLVALAYLVQPLRRQLVLIGEQIITDPGCTTGDRERANRMMDNCMSFKVGLVLPFAAIAVMLDVFLKKDGGDSHEPADPRLHQMMIPYFASVLAANPIFALLALPLIAAGVLVSLAKGTVRPREVAEEPVLRASEAVAL